MLLTQIRCSSDVFRVQVSIDPEDSEVLHMQMQDQLTQTRIHVRTDQEIRFVQLGFRQYSMISKIYQHLGKVCQFKDLVILDQDNCYEQAECCKPHTIRRFKSFATAWLYGEKPCIAAVQLDCSPLARIFVRCNEAPLTE